MKTENKRPRQQGERSNEALVRARAASGKTHAQVAREVGIAEAVYQRYEYNKNTPNVRTAIRIAQALGSTVEDIFGAATPGI